MDKRKRERKLSTFFNLLTSSFAGNDAYHSGCPGKSFEKSLWLTAVRYHYSVALCVLRVVCYSRCVGCSKVSAISQKRMFCLLSLFLLCLQMLSQPPTHWYNFTSSGVIILCFLLLFFPPCLCLLWYLLLISIFAPLPFPPPPSFIAVPWKEAQGSWEEGRFSEHWSLHFPRDSKDWSDGWHWNQRQATADVGKQIV